MSMGMSLELGLVFAEPLFFIGMVLMLMLTKAALLWLLTTTLILSGVNAMPGVPCSTEMRESPMS